MSTQVSDWSTQIAGTAGFILGQAMYGVSLGQCIFYFRSFPKDLEIVKCAVLVAIVLDSLHSLSTVAIYWQLFLTCHRNMSSVCLGDVSWPTLMGLFSSAAVGFIVQCFYVHRVWIISERNRFWTIFVAVTAVLQFTLGMNTFDVAVRTRNSVALYQTKFLPLSALAAALCDIGISTCVVYYLREGRSGVKRMEVSIHQLLVVFVHCGVFTMIIALAVFLVYMFNGEYYTTFPTAILPKSYVNSMLAVLNARYWIRARQRDVPDVIEIPTLPTIT